MKNRLNTRYIVELVITLILILVIAVVLVRFFVLSRNQSVSARDLTRAVNIAENIAEISAVSVSREEFVSVLSSTSQVRTITQDSDENGDKFSLVYVFTTAPNNSVVQNPQTDEATDRSNTQENNEQKNLTYLSSDKSENVYLVEILRDEDNKTHLTEISIDVYANDEHSGTADPVYSLHTKSYNREGKDE